MLEIRVAFFLPHLAGGGAERVALNLAAEYRKLGVKVDFVLVQTEGIFMESLPQGARLINLKSARVLFALPGLVRYLHSERPDAIFSAPNHTHIILLLAKMISGSTVHTMLHIGNHVSSLRRTSRKLQEKIYPFLLWSLKRYADVFIAVSDGVAQDLVSVAHIPPGKIKVVYNPIYRPEMEDLIQKPVNHPWLSEGQPPVILAAGRLVEQKDYPTLLRAFVRLRSLQPAHLIILGEGKLLNDLRVLSVELGIAENVDFAGFDPNPYRYMARCSVFILSSAWEGFANVVAEALACGAQVVATNCESGPAEILSNGNYGQLVPVGDDAALARAIGEALDHPLPKEILRQRGRSFSASEAATQYLKTVGIQLS
jgi:glycosyltransferase involved in cell wall biosynthesis